MVIETHDLTKLYGEKVGCEKICLSVGEGQIFGFLGPNGAGKSTFVKMLVGLIKPTSGTAKLLGAPLGDVAARRRLGFLPENFRYQDWLSGRELLYYHAALAFIPRHERESRIDEVLRMVKLSAAADGKIKTYSKGMQQRVGIAAALISDPDLLFLDEPTSALDPIGRLEVREIITSLRDRGKAVFLNSHLLSELEMICDSVAIIKGGRVVEEGTLTELLKGRVEVEVTASQLNGSIERVIDGLGRVLANNGSYLLVELDSEDMIPTLATRIIEAGGKLYNLSRKKRTLEELFLGAVKGGEA
ncbi:MAG: ABC transporter ATP-binding protein [Candidatus Aquicultor sp.]|nr:ABC transporter ATP-binding protein [Candidatus Aquicultor sp.]